MIITTNNIVYYLLDQGLVTFESVVDVDLMVVDASRRNRNFKVIRKHHQGYFVKQIQQWEPQAIATMQFEAMCYSLSQSDDNFAPLALLMPKFYAYDPGRYVLIVELLVDVYQAVKDNLKPETPLFTKRLAAGLGFAEDPGNGESFGMSRCRIVAEGLWSAYV